MIKSLNLQLYQSEGETLKQRGLELPDYKPFTGLEESKNYIADPGLTDAVNVAIALGQPLLITGEPGTGKTCLAASIAWQLGLDLLTFHTKTTSTATDLFYHYDALRRFQDKTMGEDLKKGIEEDGGQKKGIEEGKEQKKGIEEYITSQALGSAILLANPTDNGRKILPKKLRVKGPARSVVLIDEIDKAPRDLPNDVLNEVEKMEFTVKEADWEPFKADSGYRPILVITSNSEKNLPEAFLRRCVFYHIEFPKSADLVKIVDNRFKGSKPGFSEGFLKGAADHFEKIRKIDLNKIPATAECIAWISILKSLGLDMASLDMDHLGEEDQKSLELSYSVLAKTREDMELLKRNFQKK